MLKTREYKDVYIIVKIVKDFNEFILFFVIRRDFINLINFNMFEIQSMEGFDDLS